MKKLFVAIFAGMMLALGFSFCFAYDVATSLQFPLENYSRGDNILGSYNVVGNGKYHLGEDASASATAKVFSIGNGKVVHAKNHPVQYGADGKIIRNYGGMYVIEHTLQSGDKVCSLYAHLNFATFEKGEGDTVIKGEYLGQVGTTAQNGGWSEHLHFGILDGGYPSNSNEYVCNDWILGGYNACKSVVDAWLDPTDFLLDHQATSVLVYRVVGTVAWYPPNKSCVNAERWRYYSGGYPNGGMSIGYNSICYQEEYNIMMALGGISSNWVEIIYGANNLKDVSECSK